MSATSAANKSAFSLITQKGIPSGPDALFVLSPDSFLMTENSDIGQGCSCWCTYSVGIFPSSARCWRSAMGLRARPLKSHLAVQFPSTTGHAHKP